MIKAKINGKHIYSVDKQNKNYLVNDVLKSCEIHQIDGNNYQVIFNNRAYFANISRENQLLKFIINQNTYLVEIQNENDLMLEKLGIKDKVFKTADELKAPMPGLIMDILTKKGEVVKAGQPLLILKAMKMENIIKAPHDGRINEILIIKGQKIEKDAVMIQF